MPLITAEGLVKTYRKTSGAVEVLRGASLELGEQEAIAVMGPSGAGKSTLLNVLGGLDRPDAGRVEHDGKQLPTDSLSELTVWRRRVVGFVFQYHFLLPDFNARENLLLPIRLRREPTAADRERADELLRAMGLEDRRDHRPGELSGGEQQRVAVARAFMNGPRVILADEPFGNLDRGKSSDLSDLLFDLRHREHVGMVIVTHDPDLAARADRVLRLEDGRLVPAAREREGQP